MKDTCLQEYIDPRPKTVNIPKLLESGARAINMPRSDVSLFSKLPDEVDINSAFEKNSIWILPDFTDMSYWWWFLQTKAKLKYQKSKAYC